MSNVVAERLRRLCDEVLRSAERPDAHSENGPAGIEIYDAVVRTALIAGDTSPGIDMALHDAIKRRLAWGDSEADVLRDIRGVFERLVAAAKHAFTEPAEEMIVLDTALEVCFAASRIVALAAAGRAGKERAARMREETAQVHLKDALTTQQHETASMLRRTRRGVGIPDIKE